MLFSALLSGILGTEPAFSPISGILEGHMKWPCWIKLEINTIPAKINPHAQNNLLLISLFSFVVEINGIVIATAPSAIKEEVIEFSFNP